MRWVEGGTFAMGSDDFYPEERPVHEVRVNGFWIDEHPVTVTEFRHFVEMLTHVCGGEEAAAAVSTSPNVGRPTAPGTSSCPTAAIGPDRLRQAPMTERSPGR